MSLVIVLTLLISGLIVGFVNTLSAGGTAISIALYLALGLSPVEANATNRIGVLMQSSLSAMLFARKGYLKQKRVFILALSAMFGALLGSVLSLLIPMQAFSYAMGVSLIVMLFFLFTASKNFDTDNEEKLSAKNKPLHYIVFFLIGIYGGFVQVGTGFFLIAAGSMLLGADIIRTNAIKAMVMTLYTIVAIIVFVQGGNVHWNFGLLHSAGTFIGSFVATRIAFKKGAKFIRYIVIVVIIFTALYLTGLIDMQTLFKNLLR